MTSDRLIDLLKTIREGTDPGTGEVFSQHDARFNEPDIDEAFNHLLQLLSSDPVAAEVNIPHALLQEACGELRSLGYQPSVIQLVKLLTGSRSIVDPHFKAVTGYKQYRNVYSRKAIQEFLEAFNKSHPLVLPGVPKAKPRTSKQPWQEIDFFRSESFDKLDAEKEAEIRRAVAALGLRKANDRLPPFMAAARINYPRSFEPWTRDEQALLIEAMCYTNQLERLVSVFGRSAKSLEATGQRLIWDSREKRA